MVDALGRAGVGLASFGQHDFDFGAAHAKALVARSAFPWLTSNLVDREGRPFAGLPTRRLFRVGGLCVGFVGLTDDFGTTTQAGFDVNRRILLEVPGVDAVLTEEESEAVSVVRWVGGSPVAAPCGNLGSVVELVLERKGGRLTACVAPGGQEPRGDRGRAARRARGT